MDEEMNKAKLIEILQTKRAEWDATIAEVPTNAITEPGVAGHWSVKDIIAHMNQYEGWMAERMQEVLRGEVYTPVELHWMPFEERNQILYEQNRHRPAEDVLAESQAGFRKLMDGVQNHSESFLMEPQTFEGTPEPVIVWKLLRSEVYEHYDEHIPSIKNWLASRQPAVNALRSITMGTVEYINPDGLNKNPAFSNVIVISGAAKTIYIGGQDAVDENGNIVGKGDIAAQTKQTLRNLQVALAAAGAGIEHVIKWNLYVVEGQDLQAGFAAFQEVWGEQQKPPAITFAFVAGLAHPDFLIEIDAIAVVP
jgi:enamine deaminase RidA (YjgF/YER057c/UK114 family)